MDELIKAIIEHRPLAGTLFAAIAGTGGKMIVDRFLKRLDKLATKQDIEGSINRFELRQQRYLDERFVTQKEFEARMAGRGR